MTPDGLSAAGLDSPSSISLLKGRNQWGAGLRGSCVGTRAEVDQDVVTGMSLLLLRLIPDGPGSSRGRTFFLALSDGPKPRPRVH